MINSIFEFLNCKKCFNDEKPNEIIIDKKNKKLDKIDEDDEIDFNEENENNMEFIQNMQKEIEKETLKMKNELDNIKKDKTLLEENINKQGNIFSKKE